MIESSTDMDMETLESWPPSLIFHDMVGRQFQTGLSNSAIALQLVGMLLATLAWTMLFHMFGQPNNSSPITQSATIIIPQPTIASTLRPITQISTTTTTTPPPVMFTLEVYNSVSTFAVGQASVKFISTATGDEFRGDTDSDGIFTFEGQPVDQDGILTIEREGFVTFEDRDFSFRSIQPNFNLAILNPELVGTEDKRVSLSWSSDYVDLNLVVLQIDSQNDQLNCIVASSNRLCGDVQYGLDTLGNFGAETVTWKQEDIFEYAIVVHLTNEEEGITLIDTEAKVFLYDSDGLARPLELPNVEPSAGSRFWIVGCVSGLGGFSTFREVNQVVSIEPSGSSPSSSDLESSYKENVIGYCIAN